MGFRNELAFYNGAEDGVEKLWRDVDYNDTWCSTGKSEISLTNDI